MWAKHKKLIAVLACVAVLLLLLADLALESDPFMAYGSKPIPIGAQMVYLKARDCGAVCSGWLGLSQNPDRCAHEEPTSDYLGEYGNFEYAVRDDRLYIVADQRGWTAPTGRDWLKPIFIPTWGHAMDAYPITTVQLPELNMRPCIRIFGITVN